MTNAEKRQPQVHLSVCAMRNVDLLCMGDILKLVAAGMIKTYSGIRGSKLPDCRNNGARKAYIANPDFTHLLFIDSDMCFFGPHHLRSLIEMDKPIAALPALRRDNDKVANFHPLDHSVNVKDIDVEKQPTIEVDYIGTSFMLIKREVLDTTYITETHPDGTTKKSWFFEERRWVPEEWTKRKRTYIQETMTTHTTLDAQLLDVVIEWSRGAIDGAPVTGSDVGFCWRCREAGFSSWAYLDLIGHVTDAVIPEGIMQSGGTSN